MSESHPAWLHGEPVTVDSAAALSELISGGDGPFLPTGQKTSLGRGGRPSSQVRPLDLSGMNRILDHAHEDLTVRAGAGVGLGELDRVLARRNQWFPPGSFTEGGTVGGLIGADWRSPLCAANGSVRDYLIGVAFVDGRGRLARAGGQVVKNVAGYDLMKMLIGSLGELGVVTEVVLRLMPRPECFRGVMVEQPDAELLGRTLEAANGWFPAGLWRGDLGEGERLWVVFGGSVPRVKFQVNSVRELWGRGSSILEQEETVTLLADLTAFSRPGDRHGWGGALPSFLCRWTPGPDLRWLTDLQRGHLWIPSLAGDMGAVIPALREQLLAGEGYVHLDAVDLDGEFLWGRVSEDERSLCEKLKRVLDPDQRLAAGRLPGGI